MTSRDFCYWMQGCLELNPEMAKKGMTAAQVKQIAKHLNLVFIHEIDPSFENEEELNEAHGNTMTSGNILVRC